MADEQMGANSGGEIGDGEEEEERQVGEKNSGGGGDISVSFFRSFCFVQQIVLFGWIFGNSIILCSRRLRPTFQLL
jgi:hypothetical protein